MIRLSRMLLYCSFSLLAACASDSKLSLEESEAIQLDVHRSFEGLVAAAKSFDFDRYLEFFDTERFSGLNENGTVTHSLSEFEGLYREFFSVPVKYESLDFTRVKITVIDRDTAVLVNEFDARVLLASGEVISSSGAGLQTWSRASGAWKLVAVSSSGDAGG